MGKRTEMKKEKRIHEEIFFLKRDIDMQLVQKS